MRAIKKTVDELTDVMLRSGVSTTAIKNILLKLGFSDDQIEQIISEIPANTVPNTSLESDQIPASRKEGLASLQEELERQRSFIQSLQEEISRLALAFSKLSQEVRTSTNGPIQSNIEARITSLEASVNGIIDAIGEYVPTIIERLRAPK